MKTILINILLSLCFAFKVAQSIAQPGAQQIRLPNGWQLSPAGSSIQLSTDLPLNMAISPDKNFIAVTNNGNGKQSIDLVSLNKKKTIYQMEMNRLWLGLAFEKNRPYLYASAGNDNRIIRFVLKNEKLIKNDSIILGQPDPLQIISPTGLCIDDKKHLLYVVTKENNSLYICDLHSMKTVKTISLSAEAYTCALNPMRNELYISAWGGKKIWIMNTASQMLTDSVDAEDHPTDIAVSHNGKWLFVANANANSVSVINLEKRKVAEILNAALYPASLIGSTTNSVALSANDKVLYIANADNNCLAVYDVSKPGYSHSKGFIPTGWYPTCVRVAGKQLLVLNGKGMSSMPNPKGPVPVKIRHKAEHQKANQEVEEQYIGNMFHGTLSLINEPSEKELQFYSRQVYGNTPYNKEKESKAAGETGNVIPMKSGDISPVKYVFYVLKENRTYDQVLGDMPQGNGDSSLCLFGRKVTPNAHAISEQFVLLDNFYVDAEVSADGHNWSMAAYATDFVEKNWPSNYSGRGGKYDFDGSRAVANPTKGFIWDYCDRAGISFRNYGEFMDNGYPSLPVLKKAANYCTKYPGWNLDITDVYREQVFEHDFDSLLAVNAVPHFNTVYLPNDHTDGMTINSPTPIAYVADNDLALGKLVDHIAHSSIWKQTAIFVLEDDAQDGPDHIDAHRSVAYVISPYIKKHVVNHTMYSTSSMLRTMELIVGLPPMSQYDAAATPMWSCFQQEADMEPYNAKPALVDLNEKNKVVTRSSIRSSAFDFSKPDGAPDLGLNEVIWKSVKGEHSIMPSPKRSAFVFVTKEDND
ncbi:MAG TPA: alkaline phosphatase family protein [Puia sp.]|nr:alkaline phosphatase family protein [Puia sp.]